MPTSYAIASMDKIRLLVGSYRHGGDSADYDAKILSGGESANTWNQSIDVRILEVIDGWKDGQAVLGPPSRTKEAYRVGESQLRQRSSDDGDEGDQRSDSGA